MSYCDQIYDDEERCPICGTVFTREEFFERHVPCPEEVAEEETKR